MDHDGRDEVLDDTAPYLNGPNMHQAHVGRFLQSAILQNKDPRKALPGGGISGNAIISHIKQIVAGTPMIQYQSRGAWRAGCAI